MTEADKTRPAGAPTREAMLAVARVFYAAFASGDVASLDAAFASDWRDNTLPPGRPPGLAGMKGAITALRAGVPDLACKVEDFVVEGDRVVARITFSGQNRGGFLGKPPNGAPIRFIAFDIHRIEGGRIVESWHLEDNLTVLTQLGILPPLG